MKLFAKFIHDAVKERNSIMKRLLCILSSMNSGGAETFLMKLYRKIDRSKYQFDFCVNSKDECFYECEIKQLGGKIYRIPYKSENLREFTRGLRNVIKEHHYKYVLRVTSNAAGFMDLKIAKNAGATVCVARSSNSSDGLGFGVKVAHLLGRLLYEKYVDVKMAPSEMAAEYTFGENAVKRNEVIILHNGIDLSVFQFSEAGRARIRSEYGIDASNTVYGHIGRFTTQKNHMFLVNVFQHLFARNKNARLLLLGEGELEEKIKTKIKELGLEKAVIFGGIRSDIPDVLSAMDVFIFPSLYEGMPNTVIEAQATGLPCIISDRITREADITGLVTYLPLGSTDEWVEAVMHASLGHRRNTKEDFIKNAYDIESQVEVFISRIFGKA